MTTRYKWLGHSRFGIIMDENVTIKINLFYSACAYFLWLHIRQIGI